MQRRVVSHKVTRVHSYESRELMTDPKQLPDLDALPDLEETEKVGGDKDMVRKDATAVLDRDSISSALAALNIQAKATEAPPPEPVRPSKRGGGNSLVLPIVVGVLIGAIIAMVVILTM